MTVERGRPFLQIPGPTNVPERVLRAMSRPTIDHRSPAFAELVRSILRDLRVVFQTDDGEIVKIKFAPRFNAIKTLGEYLKIIETPLPPPPAGDVINFTEVILTSLTTEELRVLERVMEKQHALSGHAVSPA